MIPFHFLKWSDVFVEYAFGILSIHFRQVNPTQSVAQDGGNHFEFLNIGVCSFYAE